MATTQQPLPAYTPATPGGSLQDQILDRFVQRLAGDPAVTDATTDAFRALLREDQFGRETILATVRAALEADHGVTR